MASRFGRAAAVVAAALLIGAVTGGGGYLLGRSAGEDTESTTPTSVAVPGTTPSPPLFPEPTGTVVTLMVTSGQSGEQTDVLTIDIDAGTKRETPIAGGPLRVYDPPVLRQRSVVLLNRGPSGPGPAAAAAEPDAVVYPLEFDSPPRNLGKASVVLASVHPDRVWLLQRERSGAGPLTPGTVREVGLDGQPVTPERRYPGDRTPVAAVDGGLVRQIRGPGVYGDTFELWDPGTDTVRRTFATEPAFLVDAAGRWLVWLADSGLHVTDVSTGADRVVQRPSDRFAFTSLGRLSPDGKLLAARMVDASSVGSPQPPLTRFATDEIHPESWALVDLATVRTTVLERSRTVHGSGVRPTWSPDSRWFFFSHFATDPGDFGRDFGAETIVLAYRVGAAAARPLQLLLPKRSYHALLPAVRA